GTCLLGSLFAQDQEAIGETSDKQEFRAKKIHSNSSNREIGNVAHDDDDPIEAEFVLHQGIAEFVRGNYGRAEQFFLKVGRENAVADHYLGLCSHSTDKQTATTLDLESDDEDATIEMGHAMVLDGNLLGAIEVLRRHVQANPEDAEGHFWLGVALYRRGVDPEALKEFNAAAGDEGYAQMANTYRRMIQEPVAAADLDSIAAPRRWNFSVLTGYSYDSNVTLSPEFIGLGSNRMMDDSAWIVASFGDFRLIQQPDINLGLITSTFNSFHFQSSAFDAQDYMGGAYANIARGSCILGIRYEFHETLINSRHFANEHRFVPSLSIREGEFGHTTFFYEYDRSEFTGPFLIPALEPSADLHAVGVTQAVYTFGGQGRIYAGYRFEEARADGSDFDRGTH
ncbi:MAG: tetratricopeptide repeat protein, partial [Planctomycetes bacterium]|nr:tetratricopeptide repeat protein [Planctomycetota bacterium]